MKKKLLCGCVAILAVIITTGFKLDMEVSHEFPDLSGTYDIVTGVNPDGSQYGGVVTITSSNEHGNRYCLKWDIADQEESGCGDLNFNSKSNAFVLSVDWGSDYPVIYDVLDDGKLLIGAWHNGAGKENLERR